MHENFWRTMRRVVAVTLLTAATSPGLATAQSCAPVRECGDVDDSGGVVASDALKVLKYAVGQPLVLTCACSDGNGNCVSDLTQCQGDLTACGNELTACKAAPSCGDGAIGVGEHCDGANLDGYSCSSLGHVGGTLACSGSCDFDTSGCNECAGLLDSGKCWYLGAAGKSCAAVCDEALAAYDTSTLTFAGSGGTNAHCEGLLDALGAAGNGLDNNGVGCGAGYGCAVSSSGFRARCSTPPTEPASASPDIRRVCACR